MNILNRSALIVRPTESYVQWAAAIDDDSPESANSLRNHFSVYLVGEMLDSTEESPVVQRHFKEIFEAELEAWHQDPHAWPRGRSFRMFREWFDVTVQSMVYDLDDSAMESEAL